MKNAGATFNIKMLKGFLLGSAAGLVAVAGAHAADLPVKAKAVEYVKVCSLYGAGFYYIPGTDTCIKIGGYVRAEYYHNGTTGAFPNSAITGAFSRGQDTYGTRARGMLSADVRTQTEYGTLRSYMRYGQQWTTNGNGTGGASAVNFERAFIQFAGFTFGRTDSYFDFYNGAAYGFTPTQYDSTVGPAGINVAAYTAQFGNGVSASLSLEDSGQRGGGVANLGSPVIGTPLLGIAFAAAPDNRQGSQVPDIVANLRIDQAWGSAQIMGALHQVGGRYYTSNNGTQTAANGHPDDKWGWAIGAGLTLKMPWDARDTFSIQAAYTEGAIRYAANGASKHELKKAGAVALGGYSDAVFFLGSQLELTEAWSVTAAFEHYWTPNLRTSVIGAYLDVGYNANAQAMIRGVGCGASSTSIFIPLANCNSDWSAWRLGSRTLWNPVANLDVGLEVFYSKINTAYAGRALTGGANPAADWSPATPINVGDQDVWTATVRVQRNFWP